MRSLFVGGPWHGQSMDVADDQDAVYAEDSSPDSGRYRYQRHRWQKTDSAHGFDSLFIASTVDQSAYDVQISDAIKVASIKA